MEYEYYIHKTDLEDGNFIEDVFMNGLKNWYGHSIGSTMSKVCDEVIKSRRLEEFMKNSVGGNYKTVFLIKIPKDYLALVLHRDGKLDPPIPFFKDYKSNIEKYSIFTPHLIQGCYNETTGFFITNPNYCPIFDPSGFNFSDEQVRNFWMYNKFKAVSFDKMRKSLSAEELKKFDIENHIWDNIMDDYSKKYNIRKKEVIYDSSDYKNELEKCRENKIY